MKKYLYIILSACVLLSACEFVDMNFGTNNGGDNGSDEGGDNNTNDGNDTPEYDVEFHFNDIEVATTEHGATITTVRPYMTVDGEKYYAADIYLEYGEAEGETVATTGEFVASSGGIITFSIDNLRADTLYQAYLYVDGGSDYGRDYKYFAFKTTAYHSYDISCSSSVDAGGIKATVLLSDVEYLVDDDAVAIASVRLEYSHERSKQWTAIDVDGKAFNDNAEQITIPAEGEEYLLEASTYRYRVTITPKEEAYEPLTTEVKEFETAIADIEVEVSTPRVTLDDEALHVDIESINIYCDGISYPAYPNCGYYICLRKPGDNEWDARRATTTTNGMKLDIPITELTRGTTYMIAGVVAAGIEPAEYPSEIVHVMIPEEEKPAPEPPVGGDTDTTTLAGDWRLTQWRDDVPTFDVYLSITEDGVVGLWQRLTSREWELYYSTVVYEDGIIYGTYTDGISWGAAYYVTISGNTMTWVDTTDSTDISVYTRAELPENIATAKIFTTNELSPRFL